ncbi:MAG: nucleotidyltransferase family protein [Candidatus Eisenbacteria bacterium]|uniref:Nucleotidyltransferase family protein n=1 Tax=Eiseniibacteriota bacterium TaxID=2212470 RepID=A0A538TVG3_UNCEI|nr:MAG: nucleotidyltransferase family protein [Candidatus Eisenbacteria bacterium]
MDLTSLLTIARYCIASPTYREQNRLSFVRAIEAFPPEELWNLLEEMNVSGLLWSPNEPGLVLAPPLEDIRRSWLAFEAIYISHFLSELRRLGELFGTIGVQPIVLKGAAFWGTAYATLHERRVNDVDCLIDDPDQLLRACEILASHGFPRAGTIGMLEIRDHAHYQLPPFTRDLDLNLSHDDAEATELYLGRWGESRKVTRSNGKVRMRFWFDPHKALFLLRGNEYAELRPSDFMPWLLDSAYRVMTRVANLPYVATKLYIDVRLGRSTSLKLLADFLRFLRATSQDEIAESIRIAERWGVLTPYLETLGALIPLVPELELAGVPRAGLDPVRLTVDRAIAKRSGLGSNR